jgi:signal transduction histidine kinase
MDPSLPPGARLSPLESLGVLMSRLLHDLTNPLAVLAGNAQVAGLAPVDPELQAKALKSIHQASDVAGELLDRYADFRRSFSQHPAEIPAGTVIDHLVQTNPHPALWPVTIAGDFRGWVAVEPRWVAFAIWALANASGAGAGTVECTRESSSRIRPRSTPAWSTPRSEGLRISLRWQSDQLLFSSPETNRPDSLELAVIWELVRWMEGVIDYRLVSPAGHCCVVGIPLISR